MDGRFSGFAIFLLAIMVIAAVGIIPLIERFDHISLVLLIPLMFAIGAVPIAMRVARGTFDLYEITVPYFVMFFLFYGAGAIFVLFVRDVATDSRVADALDLAVFYCTLGFFCAMVGYGLGGRIIPVRQVAPGPRPGWISLGILFTIGFVGQFFSSVVGARRLQWITVTGLESLLSQFTFLATLTLFYTVYMVMSRQASKPVKVLFFGYMLPFTFGALFLNVGNKSQLILIFALPFIAHWYVHRRVPWKTLTAFALLVVFVLFPVYYTYRHYDKSYYSKGDRMGKAFGELGKQSSADYAGNALQSVAKRLAIINSTAVVVRECGSRVEYQYGKTLWLGVLSVAIPRIVWPDKPTTNIGKWFGRTFRITQFGDYSFISLSMVGELYWNFHVPGVVLGMFLMGLALRAVYARFGAMGGKNPFRLSIYVVLMYTTVLTGEGAIGAFEGALTRQALILIVIEKAFVLIEGLAARRAAAAGGPSSSFALSR